MRFFRKSACEVLIDRARRNIAGAIELFPREEAMLYVRQAEVSMTGYLPHGVDAQGCLNSAAICIRAAAERRGTDRDYFIEKARFYLSESRKNRWWQG